MTATILSTSGVPAVTGIAAFGTLVQVLKSAPGVTPMQFATVFGVGDISGPSRTMDKIDTTSHSTGVPIKTFIPGLIDPGDISFPCYWKPDDPTMNPAFPYSMEALFYSRKVTIFRLVAPDPGKTTVQFAGAVIELSEEYPKEGVVTKNTSIGISGAMEYVLAEATLVPTEAEDVAPGGGPQTIAVTSASEQGWFPVPDVPWITVSMPVEPVVGNGSVTIQVAAQTALAPARTGNVIIGDQTFVVSQLAGV
jgi:hypothetical protein